MSAKHKEPHGVVAKAPRKTARAKSQNGYRAAPCGEIDYDALYDEVTRRFPKIIERLGA